MRKGIINKKKNNLFYENTSLVNFGLTNLYKKEKKNTLKLLYLCNCKKTGQQNFF